MIVGKRDFFLDKKSVHIKLKNQDHYNLRTYLISKNLTMQDVYEGFTELLLLKDKKALNILEEICKKKLEVFLNDDISKRNKQNNKEKKNTKKYYLSELETDALYGLINDEIVETNNDNLKDENNENF